MRRVVIGRRRIELVVHALAAVFLVWLGWTIVGDTIADNRARTDPPAALAWRHDSAVALVALAERRLSAAATTADLDAVADLARRAVVADPLAESALHLLAAVADLKGKGERADALMRLADERSRRDAGAQLWLFARRIADRHFDAALGHADAVLRTRPDLATRLWPPLTALAADGAARPALVAALAADPPWRDRFLSELPRRAPSAPVTYAVLAGLQATRSPPRAAELRPYLAQLVAGGDFELAFLAWLHFLPPQRAAALPYVYNGDFELPLTGLPFDWMIAPVKGAATDIVATGRPDRGKALRVVFADRRVAYRQVSKLLVLPPGRYQLTGLVAADDLVNRRGIGWRVFCAQGDRRSLGETGPVAGTFGWRPFAASFAIPSTGCRAQWLRLELAARIAVEQRVSGAVWFDHLAIRRLDTAAAGTASAQAD